MSRGWEGRPGRGRWGGRGVGRPGGGRGGRKGKGTVVFGEPLDVERAEFELQLLPIHLLEPVERAVSLVAENDKILQPREGLQHLEGIYAAWMCEVEWGACMCGCGQVRCVRGAVRGVGVRGCGARV